MQYWTMSKMVLSKSVSYHVIKPVAFNIIAIIPTRSLNFRRILINWILTDRNQLQRLKKKMLTVNQEMFSSC